MLRFRLSWEMTHSWLSKVLATRLLRISTRPAEFAEEFAELQLEMVEEATEETDEEAIEEEIEALVSPSRNHRCRN